MTYTRPHVRTLWAPNILYEAGNPRQRLPMDLYEPEPSTPENRRRAREKRTAQAEYAARRDLMNILRGKTTRMAWDYQAEAATISDDEREYEAKLDAVRNHGYEWMIPEGKAMNQEVEAEDDAIAEEARLTAEAAAQAQQQQAARAAAQQQAAAAGGGNTTIEIDSQDDNVDVAPSRTATRREVPRRSDGTRERHQGGRASGSGAATSASTRRTSSTAGGRAAPTSRESGVSGARAPPRASGRYSSGGGSASAALPRYGAAANAGAASTARGAVVRDLDAEIPEAEEASYGASQIESDGTPEMQMPRVDFDTDEDDEPSIRERSSVARTGTSRQEDSENRQNEEESIDMELST